MTPQPNHADASGRIEPEKAAVRPPAPRTPVAGPGVHTAPRSAPEGPTYRHADGERGVTLLGRLLAEEIPDGTFGGARLPQPAAHPTRREPDPQAGAHVRDLPAALQPRRRHLRVVADTQTDTRKAA